jgi:hypothetical protein
LDDLGRQRLTNEKLNAAYFMAFCMGRQNESRTITAGATGTAATMDIVLGLHRQIKVDDVSDAWNVNATRRDVGCH